MTLPERILKLAEFDENEYEREAKRYTFTHENAHRDHEHLSDEQVKSALQHLAKFENLRLLPLIKSLALIIEKQSEALERYCSQQARIKTLDAYEPIEWRLTPAGEALMLTQVRLKELGIE